MKGKIEGGKNPVYCEMLDRPVDKLGFPSRDYLSRGLMQKIEVFSKAVRCYQEGDLPREGLCSLCQRLFHHADMPENGRPFLPEPLEKHKAYRNEFYLRPVKPLRVAEAEKKLFAAREAYHLALLNTDDYIVTSLGGEDDYIFPALGADEDYVIALICEKEGYAYRKYVRIAEEEVYEAHRELLRIAFEWIDECGYQAHAYYMEMLRLWPDKEYKRGRVCPGEIRKTPEEVEGDMLKMALVAAHEKNVPKQIHPISISGQEADPSFIKAE